MGIVAAFAFPDPRVGLRTAVATLLGGVVTAGVTYLLVARAARAVTAIALAAHPPDGKLTLGVRPRLLLTWGLTSGVPMLGVVLLFLDPSNPGGPGKLAVVYLVVVALLVGALATLLTARAVGPAAAGPAAGGRAGGGGRLRRRGRGGRRRRDRPAPGGREPDGRRPGRAGEAPRPVRPARGDDGRAAGAGHRRLPGRGGAHRRRPVRRHRRLHLAGPADRAGGDGRPAQPLLRGRRRDHRGRGRAGEQVRGGRRAVRLRRARRPRGPGRGRAPGCASHLRRRRRGRRGRRRGRRVLRAGCGRGRSARPAGSSTRSSATR